eukprot:scaffold40910_cov72-Phaeocystis_antarctica.AAC.8
MDREHERDALGAVGVRRVAVKGGRLVVRDAQRNRPDRVLSRAARAIELKLLYWTAQRRSTRRVGALQREYHVGVDVAPRAAEDDGKVDACAVEREGAQS